MQNLPYSRGDLAEHPDVDEALQGDSAPDVSSQAREGRQRVVDRQVLEPQGRRS